MEKFSWNRRGTPPGLPGPIPRLAFVARIVLLASATLLPVSCSDSGFVTRVSATTGGVLATGGMPSTGGVLATGGNPATGDATATGGTAADGGPTTACTVPSASLYKLNAAVGGGGSSYKESDH